MNIDLFKEYTLQFKDTLLTHKEAAKFIKTHSLWGGFLKYGWVSRILLGLAILLSFKFIQTLLHWWTDLSIDSPVTALVDIGSLAGNMALDSYNFLFVGGLKYVMLLLLEVVIFHLCRRTLDILKGTTSPTPRFKIFIKAQIRMIKVAIRCYFWEVVFTLVAKTFFGIFGFFEFIEPAFIFVIQCYFLGVLLLDSYNEQFKLSIKESMSYAKQFRGISLAIGLVLNIILLVPVIGTIAGPMLAAVTTTLIMYRLSDLHLEMR